MELIDVEGVDIMLAVDELANQYAQNVTLDMLDDVLDKIPLLERGDLLDLLGTMPMKLEDSLNQSNKVKSIRDVKIFKNPDDFNLTKISTGISEALDVEFGGFYKQDFILLGGKRGSGKSIFCANLVAAQHEQGKPSIYFTIEMTGDECFQRIIAILARVPAAKLKKQELTEEETRRVAKTMASLFEGGDIIYHKHFDSPGTNIYAFQDELQSSCKEKEEGRIIIVDDPNLSIATIDTKVASVKSRYGSDLCLVVVDYINRVRINQSDDKFDWKVQTDMADHLKSIARKHDVCMVSPYQMDDTGKARFAQGILDAADLALLIKVQEKDSGMIALETTKARSGDDGGVYPIKMDWVTLRIDPALVTLEEFNQAIAAVDEASPAVDIKDEGNREPGLL